RLVSSTAHVENLGQVVSITRIRDTATDRGHGTGVIHAAAGAGTTGGPVVAEPTFAPPPRISDPGQIEDPPGPHASMMFDATRQASRPLTLGVHPHAKVLPIRLASTGADLGDASRMAAVVSFVARQADVHVLNLSNGLHHFIRDQRTRTRLAST